jgi:hypothetical protein
MAIDPVTKTDEDGVKPDVAVPADQALRRPISWRSSKR